MKKLLKTLLSVMLASTMLATGLVVPSAASAKEYDKTVDVKINGFDVSTDDGYVIVYPNKTDSVRKINANEYNFRYIKIMVFDKDGKLIEAGGEMFANSASQSGSIQEFLYVPAGGFAVAFKPAGVPTLKACFDYAMEKAMIYNSTMSVIRDVKGSYTEDTLTVSYDFERPLTNAKKFLFIGNSATYVNGSPTKFKGLALAAGVNVEVDYGTFGSSYLSEFADENHQYGIAMRKKLRENKYDYVVLQDAGGSDYYSTKPAVEKILPLVKANGAEALLYMRYSASSSQSGRLEGAKIHHNNYGRIGEELSLTVAPAADAFLICTEKYPEIDLYSDDNSHHSKEGSYLIGCTMLMSYLGVDPRGNTYDAQLGDIAAKLQECAYIACTEGYDFEPDEKDIYTDKKGDKYDSISVNKPYTVSGSVYDSDKWSDADASGKPVGKLTDGKYASDGADVLIGCWKDEGHSVTVDLGSISQLRAFKTDMHGNGGWGITDPKDAIITVAISNDGVSFNDIGTMKSTKEGSSGEWTKYSFILELGSPVMAKYVRLTYNSGKFNWVSEISVYGTEGSAGNEVSTDASTDISSEESNNASGEASEESTPEPYVEHENKSLAWLYWLIGAVVVIAVGGIAIAITKKKKV